MEPLTDTDMKEIEARAEARVRELERLLAIATQSQDFCFVCGRSDCQHRPDVPDSVRAVKAEAWSAAWKSLAAELRRSESSHDRHFRHYVRASNQIGDVE